jgi:hypothetical protein
MESRLLHRAATVMAAVFLAIQAPLMLEPSGSAQASVQATPGEDLNAMIEPSIVHVTTTWRGFVLYRTAQGGQSWSQGPLEAASTCSGFFVTSTGHIVTAGHCVQPDMGREGVIKAFLNDQVNRGLISQADAEGLLPGALIDWKVEGQNDGSPIVRIIQAVQPKAVRGAVLDDPLNAQLIDLRPFEEGDVALLKVETTNAVPIPIATADPKSGSALTAVGFPGSVGEVVDVNLVKASFKTGTVSSTQISPTGVSRTEVNADISPGMSGGPTVDTLGNTLGVVSSYIRGGQGFNFITDTTDLRDWVGAKNLQLPAQRTAPAGTGATQAAPQPTSGWGGIPVWVWVLIGVIAATLIGLVTLLVHARRGSATRQAAPTAAMASPGVRQQWGGAAAPAPSSEQTGTWASQPTDAPRPQTQSVENRCPNCQEPNGTAVKFCGNCGTSLRGPGG